MGYLSLKENAFEEITEKWYFCLFTSVPIQRWSHPYQDLGWFICKDPYSHDSNTGEAYHCLCICYNGKYYAGRTKLTTDVKKEISNFLKDVEVL